MKPRTTRETLCDGCEEHRPPLVEVGMDRADDPESDTARLCTECLREALVFAEKIAALPAGVDADGKLRTIGERIEGLTTHGIEMVEIAERGVVLVEVIGGSSMPTGKHWTMDGTLHGHGDRCAQNGARCHCGGVEHRQSHYGGISWFCERCGAER